MRAALMAAAAALLASGLGACGGDDDDVGGGGTGDLCGGIAGLECAVTHYCDWEDGSCGFADGAGTCRVRPEACDDVVDPACGCDGEAYGNACEAARRGVDELAGGACRREETP